MKIILVKDVDKLGSRLDVKNVKPGYARNFLIPNKFAILATGHNMRWLKDQLKVKEQQVKEKASEFEAIIKKIQKEKIEIDVKVGMKNELFEKINEQKIVKILQGKGHNLKTENVVLKSPITKTGNYEAILVFSPEIEGKIKIIVKGEKETKEEKKGEKLLKTKVKTKKIKKK
jgi:large subunit ribosomal protein L9